MRTDLTPGAARKSLGQHFLFDRDLLRRIVRSGGRVEGRTVIEVGPGPGGLTRALLDEGVNRLVAIEMDERFAEGLRAWPEHEAGRLVVHRADALEVNEPALLAAAGLTGPAMIVANLPYNVGTPLLVKWLKAAAAPDGWRGTMVLMFQKEVAQRICAAPDDDHYGRLAVLSQAVTRPRMALVVPPGAFRPPPKVDSAVVVFEPLPMPELFPDLEMLERVAAAAFGQRRKMLRSSLRTFASSFGTTAELLLAQAGIAGDRRAETLSQAEFRTLAATARQLVPASASN